MKLESNIRTIGTIICGFARMAASAFASLAHRPTRVRFLEAARVHFRVYLYRPRLPQVSAVTVMDESLMISLTRCIRNEWQTTLVELAVIVGIAKTRTPASVFEIGTFDGRTTLALHLNCQESVIHTIDLPGGKENSPGGNDPGYLFRDMQLGGKIRQLYGDTLTFDFSPWWGSQDFVFVDAGHSYRNAAADSKTALRLIEGREGVVVWHDYTVLPGVTKAVEEVKEHVDSLVDFVWIEGTSLAVMICHAGHPLRLDRGYSGSFAFSKESETEPSSIEATVNG